MATGRKLLGMKQKIYAGGKISFASIKEKETHWSEVPCTKPPSETGKEQVRLETPTQISTQQKQGKRTRHTHPLKQVPSKPKPISLPTRPRGRPSTEESNRGQIHMYLCSGWFK